MARPRKHPRLSQLATTSFAPIHLKKRFGVAGVHVLVHALRAADAFQERTRAILGGPSTSTEVDIVLPDDARVRPLFDTFLGAVQGLERHDEASRDVLKTLSSGFRTAVLGDTKTFAAGLVVDAARMAKLPAIDEYDCAALEVHAGLAAPESRDRMVKSRIDRWRYGLNESYFITTVLHGVGVRLGGQPAEGWCPASFRPGYSPKVRKRVRPPPSFVPGVPLVPGFTKPPVRAKKSFRTKT